MTLLANITGPAGPPGPGYFRPESYDLANITYSSSGIDYIIYSLASIPNQRVDFTYTGDQITTAVVTGLPSNAVIRTISYFYTGYDLTSWTVEGMVNNG